MKARYGLLSFVLIALVAQLGIAQGDPGNPPPNHMQLMFVSQPPLFGRTGVPYKYTAQARSTDSSAVIRYFSDLITPPDFAIDSISGVVTWTPPASGWYKISLVARSSKGEIGIQRFMVTVTSGNGIVQGKVSDTTGAGIPRIVIEILQAVNVGPMRPGYLSYAAKTDMNGNYRFSNVDPGKYKLHAISPDPRYASQWYDGKASALEANVITVTDSPSVTIANFTLRGGLSPLPLISVSGSVRDTASAPIKGAEVFFVHTGFALNTNSTVDDFRRMFDLGGSTLDFHLDGRSPHVFRASTDSLGEYSLKVVPGAYIAFARARGYAKCFFVNESDMLTAVRLLLTRDTTGIDFVLRKLPPIALGAIQGSVLDTVKGVGVRSRIIAFRDRWAAINPYPVPHTYTADTDSLGAYSLEDLPPGGYYVLALPVGSYAPAFYTADTSSTNWRRATRVFVQGNIVTGIDIFVYEIAVTARGFAGIRGRVLASAEPVTSVAGAMVYAWSNSSVGGFGIADGSGQYEIAGLGPGTYTVSVDLPGYEPVASKTATVSYSPTGIPQFAIVDLNLSAITTSVTDGAVMDPESFVLSQNYPNPFNPLTSIQYTIVGAGGQGSGASNTRLVVYDLLGREVAVLVNEKKASGTYEVRFDASGLSSGVYLYRLTADGFMQTRRMILLK